MMAVNNQEPGGEDPEMQQLNGMMDKILDIQHPERVKERIGHITETNKRRVLAVNVDAGEAFNSALVNNSGRTDNSFSNNRFYSLNEDIDTNVVLENAVKAVIHETQTLTEGSVVKFRLVNDVFVDGGIIPKNTFVFGLASLSSERLRIRISHIRRDNSLYPVNLWVFDLDGINGIYIPGAIARDVAKQSTGQALQGLGLTTVDQSIPTQAAAAGLEAAKSMLSKKAKLIKVTVKAGYQVLLKDEKGSTSF
jgi:conjugative transposon TraM protein